ncbi:uncharacterized protein LOC132316666 [Cornus florida]|uniref:uncharacterized protein LOC132316666 n=1 Tax=Cornus florida TaxID=4283 RepID=UPI00289987E5|nr:uncharacterized protein LOC132316666 [Cornus florida]
MSEKGMLQLPEPQPNTSEPEKMDLAAPSNANANIPESLLYKNRLQEYTQRSAISLPIYQTANTGVPHAPNFTSTVFVDGSYYTSSTAFSNRKAAEQDAAKVALIGISKKLKDEGCPLISEDTVFCKQILNEYAMKKNLKKPTYDTVQSEGLLPVFVSSLVFNGVTYTGVAGRNKKEAEQLAARAVILSILGDLVSATYMSEIIKSKLKLYAALGKVTDSHNTHNVSMPVIVNTGNSSVLPLNKEKEAEVSQGTGRMPVLIKSKPSSGPIPPIACAPSVLQAEVAGGIDNMPVRIKSEPSSVPIILPIASGSSVLPQPLVAGSTVGRKRSKNKKKTDKRMRGIMVVTRGESSRQAVEEQVDDTELTRGPGRPKAQLRGVDANPPRAPTYEEQIPALAPAPAPVVNEPLDYFMKLQRVKIDQFAGSSDPLISEAWLDLMVRKLDSMAVPTDRLRISLTSSMFMGDADSWWRSISNVHNVETMTWVEFREHFFERFFPRAMRQEMRIQFAGLYQGTMSVIEYETRFTSLSRYAEEMVATDETRAKKFQDGLHLDIRPRVSLLDLRTYREVVQRAMLVEAEDRDQLRIRGSRKQFRGEALSSSGSPWKKAKAGDSTHTQGPPQQARSAPTVPVSSGSARGVICHHCQQLGHIKPRCPQLHPWASQPTASTKGGQGICHYCKQPGHIKKECPKLQRKAASGTGSQAPPAQSTVV